MPVAYCSQISAGTTHKLSGLSVGRDGNSLYGLIEDTWALHGGKPGMKEGDRYFGQVCAMGTMIMHAFALMIFCTLMWMFSCRFRNAFACFASHAGCLLAAAAVTRFQQEWWYVYITTSARYSFDIIAL